MSRDRDDVFWRRIEASGWPSPEELASTERELAATDCEPLPPAMIERIVSAAVRDFGAGRIHAVMMAERRATIRRFAGAAAALLCLLTLSWIGAKAVWPTAEPMSRRFWTEIDRAVAVVLTPASERCDAEAIAAWRAACTTVVSDTKNRIRELAKLRQDGDGEVAAAAERALSRLHDGNATPATGMDAEIKATAATAGDVDATPARRCVAIAHLEQLLAARVIAINETQALPPDLEFRQGCVQLLALALRPYRQAR